MTMFKSSLIPYTTSQDQDWGLYIDLDPSDQVILNEINYFQIIEICLKKNNTIFFKKYNFIKKYLYPRFDCLNTIPRSMESSFKNIIYICCYGANLCLHSITIFILSNMFLLLILDLYK